MAKSLPIPSPPPTPNGDRWVECWRTDDEVYYSSEDGWASISLCLISDKDGRRWEWRGHYVIEGIDLRALTAEWEQSRESADDSLFDPLPVPSPVSAPVARAVPEEHMGREERRRAYEERKAEPEPEDRKPVTRVVGIPQYYPPPAEVEESAAARANRWGPGPGAWW